MKSAIGLILAFGLGFSCRAFGIPSPAPPVILGALLVMAMTVGYDRDRRILVPAHHARDCGGPSGLSASQIPAGGVHWSCVHCNSRVWPRLEFRLVELPDPEPNAATAVVKVAAASITPSDIKNVAGKMEHTTLPRIPGRDYAGTVVAGPAKWVGKEVWGTGGELGYTVNGSHAELIAVPTESLQPKPSNLSFEQAAAIGLTYLAAWLALVEYARLTAGETLLVIGANGGVGRAAMQIAKWRGARVIGADREKLAPDTETAVPCHEFIVSAIGPSMPRSKHH